eukprot:1539202-Prymnesium_polylepis.1
MGSHTPRHPPSPIPIPRPSPSDRTPKEAADFDWRRHAPVAASNKSPALEVRAPPPACRPLLRR